MSSSDSNSQLSSDNNDSNDEVNSCQSQVDEDKLLVLDGEDSMDENERDQDDRNRSSSDSYSQLSSDNDEVYSCQFQPYEDEPLVHEGEDLMEENSQENERDEDGLTPAVLEARFDRKIKFDSW